MSKPLNILLVLTDQQRWDSLACYGATGVHTPHLDALAKAGTRYERCYVNATLCTPSRASLWTGKHIPGHGVHALHDCLADDEVLFPQRLQQAGYDTALFGKLHASGHNREARHRHPNDGFDTYEWAPDPSGPWGLDNAYLIWLQEQNPSLRAAIKKSGYAVGHIPAASHMTTWAAERAIDYVRQRAATDQPFFCCMSVFDPHSPYDNYPREMEDLLDVANLPAVVAANQPFSNRPLAHAMEKRWGMQAPDAATLAKWRIGYHAAIAHIDAQIGRVLAALDTCEIGEETVVIFTSDHGDMLGDHALMNKGAYFYDACARVPMIIRTPYSAQSVERAPVQLHDIASTCLQVAGQSAQETQSWSPDGISLLDSAALARRNRAVCLYRNSGKCSKPEEGYTGYFDPPIHATMWFQDDYKVNIYHSPAADTHHPRGEAYDLARDPNELENLWDTEVERRNNAVLQAVDWLALEEVRGRGRGADASGESFVAR